MIAQKQKLVFCHHNNSTDSTMIISYDPFRSGIDLPIIVSYYTHTGHHLSLLDSLGLIVNVI